jgi:hypothetical protein
VCVEQNHGRILIDSPQAWSAIYADRGSTTINLLAVKAVAGIVSQGRHNDGHTQWVTSYDIHVSMDKSAWIYAGRYTGNSDSATKVYRLFSAPIYGQYVRVTVVSVYVHASMRWDVLLTGTCRARVCSSGSRTDVYVWCAAKMQVPRWQTTRWPTVYRA